MVAPMHFQCVGVDVNGQLAALLRTCFNSKLPRTDQESTDSAEQVRDPKHQLLTGPPNGSGRRHGSLHERQPPSTHEVRLNRTTVHRR